MAQRVDRYRLGARQGREGDLSGKLSARAGRVAESTFLKDEIQEERHVYARLILQAGPRRSNGLGATLSCDP